MTHLADKLAIALCYLACIDDAVDPLAESTHTDDVWAVVKLVGKGMNTVLEKKSLAYVEGDTDIVIQDARIDGKLNIRETELYANALNSVRLLVREVQ